SGRTSSTPSAARACATTTTPASRRPVAETVTDFGRFRKSFTTPSVSKSSRSGRISGSPGPKGIFMRMSRAVAAVGAAAEALSLVSAGVADAQQDIIGGSTVSSAPWGAQIYWNNVTTYGGFECSGTIIAPQWVLTAKHCLNSPGM